MTDEIKEKIRELKIDGLGYKKIAKQLKMNLNTVISFCQRNGLGEKPTKINRVEISVYCKFCNAKLDINKIGRKKYYCNANCKKNYYKLKND